MGIPSSRVVLIAPDGRMVTNDTVRGASLTRNKGICYVWDSPARAERERAAYELILGTKLTVSQIDSYSFGK